MSLVKLINNILQIYLYSAKMEGLHSSYLKIDFLNQLIDQFLHIKFFSSCLRLKYLNKEMSPQNIGHGYQKSGTTCKMAFLALKFLKESLKYFWLTSIVDKIRPIFLIDLTSVNLNVFLPFQIFNFRQLFNKVQYGSIHHFERLYLN